MKTTIHLVLFGILSCLIYSSSTLASSETSNHNLNALAKSLKPLNSSIEAEVMTLATHHFSNTILEQNSQDSVKRLVAKLTEFSPTKIFVEWEPSKQSQVNKEYLRYLQGELSLDERFNEVYQLGFRLARQLGHNQVFLFDDQTPFIGSLKGFSFDGFSRYAKKHNSGFFDRHEKDIVENFQHNSIIFKRVSVYEQIALRNSPQAQKINAERMHAYENRVGVQLNWIGPDWLGRWYQRNVRMSSNVLKNTQNKDRILIVVGDNHKWVLDYLFTQMPEYKVRSSWELLSKN